MPCALFEPYQEFLLSPGMPSNLESENLNLKFRRNLTVPHFCSISARITRSVWEPTAQLPETGRSISR